MLMVRSRGSGTHCCYDSTGELMYSGDSVFGSTPDKAHTWGKPPYGSPPYIPSVSHWAVDLIPYYLCCAYQPESDYDCFNYFVSLRLTTDCQGYNMPGFGRFTYSTGQKFFGKCPKTLVHNYHLTCRSIRLCKRKLSATLAIFVQNLRL